MTHSLSVSFVEMERSNMGREYAIYEVSTQLLFFFLNWNTTRKPLW